MPKHPLSRPRWRLGPRSRRWPRHAASFAALIAAVALFVTSTREHGACVKAVLDVASGRDPVHLGRHETGVDEALRDG